MKTFKEQILESIIDIPRRTYAPAVFDEADTKDPKIKSSVKQLIDDEVKEFEKEYPVMKTALIGSILTKRYRNDADLDINVLFDVPKEKQEAERVRLSQKYLSAKNPDKIQGKLIPGTKHPINYYFITDQETYDDQNKKADAVFDIENNTFVKRPDDFVFDPSMYVKEFDRKVQALDVVKGELKRDIIDYKELKELTPDDVLNLQEKIKDKLDEIEDSLEAIIKIGDGVDAERRAAFNKDMSPDEIRTYGVKNRLPKNVIYKMLEKYHYLKFYKYCKEILEDGIVTDKEIDDLEVHESIASAWTDLIRRTLKAPQMKAGLNLYLKYLRQGMKDAKNKAAQHAGIDYHQFARAVQDAGLPEQMTEAREKSVAFTFGRFNPPTIGHEKLINKVKSIPTNDYKIFLSRSQDSKKNPLDPNKKLKFMKSLFKQHARNIELNPTNMVLDLATSLYNKGYTDITMVVGSDRVREFENILKKYNGQKNRHGFYDFKSIKVASAGERDPDAEGATGMSASKMRAAAEKGDIDSFKKGLPRGVSNKELEDLFVSVRSGMGLSKKLAASFGGMTAVGTGARPVASMNEFEQNQIRDLYIREMVFNINDKINYVKEDIQGIVKRRGTNYVVLEDNNNNLHKAWIWDCIPISGDREVEMREHNLDIDYGFKAVTKEDLDAQPQDKDVKKVKGTQPKKYYKNLSKDVKSKRAAHFKSSDTTKPGYKPAPGDKDAKTKPSIHTKKYKKMFGELVKDLQDACWTGYKQVGMKMKNGKSVPNCVPESYEIGADYANHTKEVTPGEKPDAKPVDSKKRGKPEAVITKEDIEKWQTTDETIDKYKKRYAEEWQSKLQEVVKRMMEKI